jgi:hypothetical protein
MNAQGNTSPPNSHHNNSESKDNELAEMLERECRSLILKMIKNLKEDSHKRLINLGNQSKT